VYKEKKHKKRTITLISNDEKIAWCNRWKASTLSMPEFCKIHPISKSSLYGWYKRFFSSNDASPAFMPLSPISKVPNEQEIVSIELTLANGAIAKLNVSLGIAVNLIQELSHAVAVIR
jgi:hypothetical protein